MVGFGARLALALSAPKHGLELELADDVAVLIDVDGASRDARGRRLRLVMRCALELAPDLGALLLPRLIHGAETAGGRHISGARTRIKNLLR